jgi:hypothetical protein
MAGEIDPQYAARFRRDYLPEAEAEAEAEAAAAESPDVGDDSGEIPAVQPRDARTAGIVLLVLATVLAALATVAVVWELLDGAFRVPPVPDPFAAVRALGRAGSGPLGVAFVVALAGGLWLLGLSRRAVVIASTAVAAALVALVAWAATELARLTSLTAQGPVSSGGIPLPEAALAVYFERIQTIAVLDRMLPWLVLAAALEVVTAVFLAGTLSPRRPA